MVARILLAWWYRLLVSAEDVEKSIQLVHTLGQSLTTLISPSLYYSWDLNQSLLDYFSSWPSLKPEKSGVKTSSLSHHSSSYPGFLWMLQVLLYLLLSVFFSFLLLFSCLSPFCFVKSLLWVNPWLAQTRLITGVPRWHRLPLSASLRNCCKLVLLFLPLSLCVHLWPLHTSLFQQSI